MEYKEPIKPHEALDKVTGAAWIAIQRRCCERFEALCCAQVVAELSVLAEEGGLYDFLQLLEDSRAELVSVAQLFHALKEVTSEAISLDELWEVFPFVAAKGP